jgi:hypothetical protein
MTATNTVSVPVLLAKGLRKYYLLKVVLRDFDVYCIPPHLGFHYSLHMSGQAHFQSEAKAPGLEQEPALAFVEGEAGTPFGDGIVRTSLVDLGRALCVCSTIFSIESLDSDFKEFSRTSKECFVIDAGLFGKDATYVEIGVWMVPRRNQAGFEFNNPMVSQNLLHKTTKCEPQIWIYAKPF